MKNWFRISAVAVLSLYFLCSCVEAQGSTTSTSQANPERAVDIHNEKRRLEGSSNMKMLTWDSKIASEAQDYAETCVFAHDSGRGSVGENIYIATGSPSKLYVSAVESWHVEIDNYDFDSGTCQQGKVCGHYTQVVWANSEKLGCGAANCTTVTGISGFDDSKIVVCRYSPAGNFGGQKPYSAGAACTDCPSGWLCNDGLCQDPSTVSTTAQTSTSTEATTQSPTPSTTMSTTTKGELTTPTTASTPGSPATTSPTASNTTTRGTTSTQGTQSTPTSASTIGSTMSSTQETSTTTESPTQGGCTGEYLELKDQWIELFNDWKMAFNNWKAGNCPGN